MKHPDLFTREEALRYLHVIADSPPTEDDLAALETLRDNHGLRGFKVGRVYLYHRKHLDACMCRLAGVPVEVQCGDGPTPLKIAGRR